MNKHQEILGNHQLVSPLKYRELSAQWIQVMIVTRNF